MLVPVLNEATRLRPCLDGLIAQGEETAEIVVIDGGSTDATAGLVREFAVRDSRVRLIEAGPAPVEALVIRETRCPVCHADTEHVAFALGGLMCRKCPPRGSS